MKSPRTRKQVRVPNAGAWDHAGRQAQDQQSVMGVGRAGAPKRDTGVAGVSRNSLSRIAATKTSRVRITRPGRG